MKRGAHSTNRAARLVRTILLLTAMLGPGVLAGEDLSGEWELAMDFNGRQTFSTLSLAPGADGALTGQWGSTSLSNVKFEGGKLTFVRTVKFGDQEFTMNYAGTLKDGKLIGTVSNDRGEYAVQGIRRRPESPAVGQWDLSYQFGERPMTAKLIVSQKPDGALEAKWTSQRGESVISNVKCVEGQLCFTRKIKFNDNEFETSFEGTVAGDKLTGTSKSERGDMAVTGQRVGAPLIGKWELTTTTERGTRTSVLIVRGDLSGRYESFGGEVPLKDLKLEGNQVSFQVTTGSGERAREMEFKGTLEGKTLKGQSTTPSGTREVTGRKLETPRADEVVLKPMARQPDVIFVPTPQEVVDKMLELAEVKAGDLVYDLGCGNGRIVVTAAKKYGVKAVGFDINPERIKESLANVRESHVEHLVTIKQEDIFTLDLSQANVITLYLLPSLNVKLIPQLEKLKPGSRIVSHDFDMRGVTPDKVITLNSDDSYGEHTIYLWTTPLKKE